ncbi:response regulator [Sphingomonas sp. CFBP 8764]|nr:response regulator [Sphingomonas sp. CFBP 8764]
MNAVTEATASTLPKHKLRLLVVEDEIFIRMFVCDTLRDAGYDVIEAVCGDEALDILKSGLSVDLVISDVRMPGATDGLALLAFVQSNVAGLPVILTSGHLSPDIALADGAAQFLAKPFKVADALKAVELEASKLR